MIKTIDTSVVMPSYIAKNCKYQCDTCGELFFDYSRAIEHYAFAHIKKMDIPGVGTAYFLTSKEEAMLFWIAYKEDNFIRFIDEERMLIMPNSWHYVFMERRPFHNEYDEWYWIAPLEDKISTLLSEKIELLDEVRLIEDKISIIYHIIRQQL